MKMQDRYAEYRKLAVDLNVDAVGLVPGSNFDRLFGQGFGTNERPILLVIPRTGNPAAIFPNLELPSVALLNFEGEVFDWYDETGYEGAFHSLAKSLPIASIAVEGQSMRVFVQQAMTKAWAGLRVVDAEFAISGLRLRKTDKELSIMAEVAGLSEKALAETLALVRVGMTELEIKRILTSALFRNGAEDLAFGPIIAAADNSARLHAHARANYQIRKGDALLIDFGARLDGFCSDISRTFFIGEASDEAREVYASVQKAHALCFEVTKAGVTAGFIDDAVIGSLESSGFADRIKCKTGHGLGRDVHEQPYIARGNPQVLLPGMVFTNEPGLYKDGAFGIRIEDEVVVTEVGCRSITAFPRGLTIL
jgi:Xaa-Pro aminopeptidase